MSGFPSSSNELNEDCGRRHKRAHQLSPPWAARSAGTAPCYQFHVPEHVVAELKRPDQATTFAVSLATERLKLAVITDPAEIACYQGLRRILGDGEAASLATVSRLDDRLRREKSLPPRSRSTRGSFAHPKYRQPHRPRDSEWNGDRGGSRRVQGASRREPVRHRRSILLRIFPMKVQTSEFPNNQRRFFSCAP